ncbi:MAG: hypothetical protein M2R45_05153 [Verrucomicrobia subdivision 3 bacterium]|nr:hypothetical protein [Limisphaerales bacterium]MCS1413796.1 hypothetical protein [Limisphaerales bacterium]
MVYRKGATPASLGVLGIIPGIHDDVWFHHLRQGGCGGVSGCFTWPGRGGEPHSSGAKAFNWSQANQLVKDQGMTFVSAGLDEVLMVYKNIHDVMAAQAGLWILSANSTPGSSRWPPWVNGPED